MPGAAEAAVAEGRAAEAAVAEAAVAEGRAAEAAVAEAAVVEAYAGPAGDVAGPSGSGSCAHPQTSIYLHNKHLVYNVPPHVAYWFKEPP